MRKSSALLLLLLNSLAFSQIHLDVDTIKMKWVENRCPTEMDTKTFKFARPVVVSDLTNQSYQWDYKWDQLKFSYYLFSTKGGDGTVTDSITLNITSWAVQGFQPPGMNTSVTLFFFEKNNPSNKDSIILYIIRPKEFKPTADYINGYPQFCYDTVTGSGLKVPLAYCTLNDFTSPSSKTVYTRGQSYVDQNFGAKVTCVSDPGTYIYYSNPTTFSAHSKYLMLEHKFDDPSNPNHGTYDFVSPTGTILHQNVKLTVPYIPCAFGPDAGASVTTGPMWDAYNDEYFYYVGECFKLFRFDLTKMKDSVLIDFSQAPYNFTKGVGNGQGADISGDNWMALYGATDTVGGAYTGSVLLVDLNTLSVYTAPFNSGQGIPYTVPNDIQVSRGVDAFTKKRYVYWRCNYKSPAIFEFDTQTKSLAFSHYMPEAFYADIDPVQAATYGNFICDGGEGCDPGHMGTTEDDAGNQYLIAHGNYAECPYITSRAIYKFSSELQMRIPVEYGGTCREFGYGPFDYACGAKNAPIFVSSITGPLRDTTDKISSFQHADYDQEIAVYALVAGEVKARRLAKARSVHFGKAGEGEEYFSELPSNISPDGKYVCWPSNQGEVNYGDPQKGVRIFVAETGYSFTTTSSIAAGKSKSTELSIFPNPSTNSIQIDYPAFSHTVGLSIVDLMGSSILTTQLISASQRLDISMLAKGVYFLQVDNHVKKLVIN